MRTPESGAFRRNCGEWSPTVYFNRTSPGNAWSGNVWDDAGTAIDL